MDSMDAWQWIVLNVWAASGTWLALVYPEWITVLWERIIAPVRWIIDEFTEMWEAR